MNLFIMTASSITVDSGKGDIFIWSSPLFGQHNTSFKVIDHHFMAPFTQLGLNTSINIKYFKKTRGTLANLPHHTVWETLPYILSRLTGDKLFFPFSHTYLCALTLACLHQKSLAMPPLHLGFIIYCLIDF